MLIDKYEILNQERKIQCAKRKIAAYCRVSTDNEDQANSFESQQRYFRQYIERNPDWELYEVFADEGISGTNTKKRKEFNRMITCAKNGEFDLIVTKEISRFARNTLDSIFYTRDLKKHGVGVIFLNDNINTLDGDAELRLAIMSSIAQEESRKTSERVKWGQKRQMEQGVVFGRSMLGYDVKDGKMTINEDGAKIVRLIFRKFVDEGKGTHVIARELREEGISPMRVKEWSNTVILRVIRNEKYCGDVLMQKTFTQDCISKKQLRNMGQLPMYLVQDNHEGIISRNRFNQAKAEFARRNAGRAPSQKLAPTGRSCYSAKYALTERLVCGECGTLYRRCVWVKRGQKFAVWRCASRIDYGTKYCHDSPTLREETLQAAILAAINTVMSQQEMLMGQIEDAMRTELIPFPSSMSISDIDQRLDELDKEFQGLFADSKDGGFMKHAEEFKRISADMAALKTQRADLLEQQNSDSAASQRIASAMEILSAGSADIQWNESTIRQLVDTVKVLSANRIRIYLQGGIEIEQELVD